VQEERKPWPEDWDHSGRLPVFPVAVKNEADLSCMHNVRRADWKLKNFRLECVREKESRLESASNSSTLFFHNGEVMK